MFAPFFRSHGAQTVLVFPERRTAPQSSHLRREIGAALVLNRWRSCARALGSMYAPHDRHCGRLVLYQAWRASAWRFPQLGQTPMVLSSFRTFRFAP